MRVGAPLPAIKRLPVRTITSRPATASIKPVKPFHAIPGPRPLPVLGNIWRYLPVIGDYKVDTLYENACYNLKRYGPIVREQLTSQHTILHLFDPSDIESLFRQDSRYPMRRSHRALLKYRCDRPEQYVDGGLFPENNQNWYRQRTLFQAYFSKSRVATLVDKISLATDQLIEEVSNQKELTCNKFEQILYRWALNNSLLIFLDCDIRQLEESLVDNCLDELHNSLVAIEHTEMYSQKWMKRPDKCPFYKMLSQSQEFLYEFVTSNVRQSKQEGLRTRQSSLLKDFLLVNKLDPRDVTSFVIDSLMAGLHTTSYVAAHLLYHICNTVGLEQASHKEINARLGDAELTFERVESMTLLKNCLKETLRLNPVSIGTGRVSHKNLNIRGYNIPPGIMIITQNQVISRDPQVFTEPDLFKPDRWSVVNKLGTKPSPFASLPFGFGPRACIGRRLAELQVKVLTAKLLSQFDMVDFKPIPTKTTLVHVFDGHLEVKFRRRHRVD